MLLAVFACAGLRAAESDSFDVPITGEEWFDPSDGDAAPLVDDVEQPEEPAPAQAAPAVQEKTPVPAKKDLQKNNAPAPEQTAVPVKKEAVAPEKPALSKEEEAAAKAKKKAALEAKKKKRKEEKPEWEPPSNAKWRTWIGGGAVSVVGPRAVQRTTNGKTQWQGGFTYATAPRWRAGVSYAELSMKGSARAKAVHLAATRVLQPWEKWTPLVSFGLGTGSGPDSKSLKNISGRAGLGIESFVTRHLSVGLSGDYFYFAKAGAGKSEWHALATSVFVAHRFGYRKKQVKEEPEPEEIAESTAAANGMEMIETSTASAAALEEAMGDEEEPAISTAPVRTIPGFAPPAPATPPPGAAPSKPAPKPTLSPPAGWTAVKAAGTQAVLYVQFEKNKFKIRPEWHDHLKKIAAFLKAHPEAKAFIEGHASSDGPAGFNMRLSRHRANVVRKYLINNYKIDPKRLVAKGFGEKRPLAGNDTEAGRRRNRCAVSYIILKKPQK